VRQASLAFVAMLGGIAGCNGCSKPQSGDPLPTGTSKPSTTTTAVVSAAPSSSAPRSPGGDTNVTLTHARTATPTTKGLPMIAITTKELRFVGTKNEPIPMPAPVSWYAGMPLSAKGDKAGSMFLFPVAAWLKEARKGQEHDLSIVADNSISYRIVGEVLYTAALGGYDRFHLVALTPDDTYGEMVIEMPGFKADAGPPPPFASILVAPEGISIKTEMSNVGPGCTLAPGLAFPRINGQIDAIGVPSCMDKITPDGGGVPDIVIGAPPEIPFGEVAVVIDGVRARKAATVVHLGLQKIPTTAPTIPGLPALPPGLLKK
jgi:hypothetical protein